VIFCCCCLLSLSTRSSLCFAAPGVFSRARIGFSLFVLIISIAAHGRFWLQVVCLVCVPCPVACAVSILVRAPARSQAERRFCFSLLFGEVQTLISTCNRSPSKAAPERAQVFHSPPLSVSSRIKAFSDLGRLFCHRYYQLAEKSSFPWPGVSVLLKQLAACSVQERACCFTTSSADSDFHLLFARLCVSRCRENPVVFSSHRIKRLEDL
jgi:hypothetical protein